MIGRQLPQIEDSGRKKVIPNSTGNMNIMNKIERERERERGGERERELNNIVTRVTCYVTQQ